MSKDIDRIVSLIFATRRLIHEQTAGKSQGNCSFMHMATLVFIKAKKPLMKDIADFLGIAPPSATSLVNTLTKTGLVKREQDMHDRRIVRITVTKKGEQRLAGGKKHVEEKMRKRLEKLSLNEQKELIKILEKIVNE
ncbi:MAG TPA: MarR family transcriptional regulator [Patescibacteria group bacterium]